MRYAAPLLLACAVLVSPSAEAIGESGGDPASLAAVAERLAPSVVRVEYTLQYDKSESPYGGGWRERCPGCGRYHISSADSVIAQERPVESSGILLSPTTVLTADPMTHNRFIKEIVVRHGDAAVSAQPSACAAHGSTILLELDQPLPGAAPITFDANHAGPYYAVSYAQMNGSWSIGLQALSTTVTVAHDGRKFTPGIAGALIVDAQGRAVGACASEELAVDGSWKGSPLSWPTISQAELERMLARLETDSSYALPRVHVIFRSPKTKERASRYGYFRDDDEAASTEWHGAGVLVDPSTVLVLGNFNPDVTARLERVRIFGPQGETRSATFRATLKDYGAFVATLDQPMSNPAQLSAADIRTLRNDLLLSTEVQTQGETRVTYYTHVRIPRFEIDWRQQVIPDMPHRTQFLFSRGGELLAIPLERRKKVTVEEEYSSGRGDAILIPATYVREVLANLDANADSSNVPLSEEEESRTAWMGLEMQPLDTELARANNVSELTNDGSTGALISWVYEDSPAAAAGIEVGDIVLRLHVDGHPKPLDVVADEDQYGGYGFPWERLDEVPEEYFDQIPPPWPSAQSEMNRKLTRLGFGTAYKAEVVRNGELMQVPLNVVASPPHYTSAPQFKSDAMGLTVKALTYEVQRYLQRQPSEPGVIISRIEPGSRASIAGLKPFELVTHVNDVPIMSAADFETAVRAGGELRLSIKRMTRGRVVKINMDAPAPDPEPDGDEEIEDDEIADLDAELIDDEDD